jgi:hypothetical protein
MKKSNESKNLNTHQKLLEVQKYSLSWKIKWWPHWKVA